MADSTLPMHHGPPPRGKPLPAKPHKPLPSSLRDRHFAFLSPALYSALISTLAEFFGTTFYLFFALSCSQIAHTPALPGVPAADLAISVLNPTAPLLYTALGFGFSLVVWGWVFFRVTGALFSPAVAVGMALLGTLGKGRAVGVVFAQFAGGLAAAGLVGGLFPGRMRGETVLGGGTGVVRGFFIEMLLTAAFVFSVFVLAADKHKGTVRTHSQTTHTDRELTTQQFLAPIGIGLSLFLTQLAGLPFTGAGLNPARSFATAVLNRHFPTYHWIYWLAPILGGILAAGFYKLTKFLELETAIGMRGESALGHRRGVSNASSNATGGGVMAQAHHGHVLQPVQEDGDLEKGPREGNGGAGMHDPNASDSDTTGDLRSPRVSGQREH
ncbi:hypothetical protein LTR95_010984 [Oleoguttula sp. CCFEE 5521]